LINEVEAAYNAATPGEWWKCDSDRTGLYAENELAPSITVMVTNCEIEGLDYRPNEADAAFIEMAHDKMLRLLALARKGLAAEETAFWSRTQDLADEAVRRVNAGEEPEVDDDQYLREDNI